MTRLRKDGRPYAKAHQDDVYFDKLAASNARFAREHRPYLLSITRARKRYAKAQAIYKEALERLQRERAARWQKMKRPSDGG
jgi:hypothetical protein